MLVPLVILALALLGIAFMLLFRVWELRAGRLSVREEDVPDKFISIDEIEESAEQFLVKARIFSIHFLAYSIHHLAIFFRQVKEEAGKEFAKISAHLPKHIPPSKPGSSFFLKDISAHKEEVRRENGYHE